MTLRWRIATALGALAAAATVAVAVTSYLTTSRELAKGVDDSLRARAEEIGRGPGRSGPETVEDNGCPPEPLLRPASAAQVVTDVGTVVLCLPGGPPLPAPTIRPAANTVALSTVAVDGVRYRVAATSFHAGGVLQLAQSLTAADRVLGALRRRLIVITVLATALAGAAGWLLARRLVRPLVALRDITRALTDQLVHRRPLDPPGLLPAAGEVADLRDSFATLVDVLAVSQEQQRRLVADAGHEIRTPLTSLNANLDLLDRADELPAEERPEILAAVRADVRELTELMTQLLDLAADPTSDEPVVDTDLAELAESVAARAQRRSGRTITTTSTERGLISARPVMLERAITNLLDNAQKYSPHTTPIEIHTTRTSLVVVDRGPGIPEADRQHMFERFWRADATRSQPGTGLGLAIVQQIVARHDGELVVGDRPEGGLSIGFRLPNR